MGKIGINLGTTNSLAAYFTDDGPKIIPNAFGEKRAYISMIIDKFESVLEKQNEMDIKKAAEIFKHELDSVEG